MRSAGSGPPKALAPDVELGEPPAVAPGAVELPQLSVAAAIIDDALPRGDAAVRGSAPAGPDTGSGTAAADAGSGPGTTGGRSATLPTLAGAVVPPALPADDAAATLDPADEATCLETDEK